MYRPMCSVAREKSPVILTWWYIINMLYTLTYVVTEDRLCLDNNSSYYKCVTQVLIYYNTEPEVLLYGNTILCFVYRYYIVNDK